MAKRWRTFVFVPMIVIVCSVLGGLVPPVTPELSAATASDEDDVKASLKSFTAIYRTEVLPVARGIRVHPLPRWRVLDGDRLAVWSDNPVLGMEAEASGHGRSLAVPLDVRRQVRSLKAGEGEPGTRLLAIRAWGL